MTLQVAGLTSGYGGAPVLHGIDMEIAEGEVVAVVGANGAGKSTLVATLSGLLPASSGTVALGGHRLDGLPAHRRVHAGLVPVLEGRHLFAELSVADTLRLAHAIGSRREKQVFGRTAVANLFPILEQKADVPVGVLSGGQQQMVAIAKALLLQPELLVLDEMSTGLAPILVEEILEVLSLLQGQGMSMLIIEQSVGVAAEISDRAYVLDLGRVVKEGPWDRLGADDVAATYLGGAL
jgi:ABC-type branched-subunit amino acid transport system ATPase component